MEEELLPTGPQPVDRIFNDLTDGSELFEDQEIILRCWETREDYQSQLSSVAIALFSLMTLRYMPIFHILLQTFVMYIY